MWDLDPNISAPGCEPPGKAAPKAADLARALETGDIVQVAQTAEEIAYHVSSRSEDAGGDSTVDAELLRRAWEFAEDHLCKALAVGDSLKVIRCSRLMEALALNDEAASTVNTYVTGGSSSSSQKKKKAEREVQGRNSRSSSVAPSSGSGASSRVARRNAAAVLVAQQALARNRIESAAAANLTPPSTAVAPGSASSFGSLPSMDSDSAGKLTQLATPTSTATLTPMLSGRHPGRGRVKHTAEETGAPSRSSSSSSSGSFDERRLADSVFDSAARLAGDQSSKVEVSEFDAKAAAAFEMPMIVEPAKEDSNAQSASGVHQSLSVDGNLSSAEGNVVAVVPSALGLASTARTACRPMTPPMPEVPFAAIQDMQDATSPSIPARPLPAARTAPSRRNGGRARGSSRRIANAAGGGLVRDFWEAEVQAAVQKRAPAELLWALQFAEEVGVAPQRLANARQVLSELGEAITSSLTRPNASSSSPREALDSRAKSVEAIRLAEELGVDGPRLAEAWLSVAERSGDPHYVEQEMRKAREAGVPERRLEEAQQYADTLRAEELRAAAARRIAESTEATIERRSSGSFSTARPESTVPCSTSASSCATSLAA